MFAWFNRKTARAMAKMAGSLKAESLARAQAEEKLRAEIEAKNSMERKVKAEAEKMLLAQFNRYSVLVERAEAETKAAKAAASAQAKEAERKIQFYASALAQAEEKLSKTQEQLKAEALARAKAEESLKVEREDRIRVEAQVEDSIAAAKDKAEEKVQSYAAALTETEEKLKEAKERVEVVPIAEAKAEDGLKFDRKERQSFDAQPAEVINTLERNRRSIFHPVNIKRTIILLLVLAIFSALTFTLGVADDPSSAEPGVAMIREQTSAPETTVGSDTDREQLNFDVAAPSQGSLNGTADGMTNSPALNYESTENITFKVSERISAPVSDTQSMTITAQPAPLEPAGSAGGKNNVVQSSDNNRWEAGVGSDIYCEFSDVSITANAAISSVVLFVEHFEEERFAEGKLEWAIGTGWPDKPVVWAAMKAPVREGELNEAVDAWDITRVVDTAEKINSLQLQIKNNNNVANGKTLVDCAYVVIEYH